MTTTPPAERWRSSRPDTNPAHAPVTIVAVTQHDSKTIAPQGNLLSEKDCYAKHCVP